MENNPLRQQIADMRQSLFDEGMLDRHYQALELLSDGDNPNFAEEIMSMFFRDSIKVIAMFEKGLENPPLSFVLLDKYLHKLKGCSGSIGAKKVWEKINETRDCLRERNIEGTKVILQQLKKEHDHLRGRIEPYFQMLRQVGPAEVAERPL